MTLEFRALSQLVEGMGRPLRMRAKARRTEAIDMFAYPVKTDYIA
jgi:hypothetical protein